MTVRVVYGDEPDFPSTDQHPQAKRHRLKVDGREYFVDYVGKDKPTAAEVRAVIKPKKES